MTWSPASSHLRRAAPRALAAFHVVCSFIACATVVEDPPSTTASDQSSGLVSSTTDGMASTTVSTTNSTQATTAVTSTVSVTSATAATTTGVTTSGEAASTTTGTTATTATATTAATTTTTTTLTASSATVSSTATASSSDGAGGATTGSFATTATGGAGGSTVSATTATTSTTGTNSEYCDDPQTPAENVAAEGSTGTFDTTAGVCYRLDFVPADFAGWGCSNFQSAGGNRSIVVNGTSVSCGEMPLPEPVDGSYYFDIGPGTNVSAVIYWWNWE